MQELLEYGAPTSRELDEGSIEEVIAKTIRSCAALAGASDVSITSKIEGVLGPILIDRRRLPQVFVNLIENAIHHSQPGGEVMVEARQVNRKDQNWVECCVKDCGQGFSKEDIEKVFEPFYTRRKGGTGLGLSIAQRIVEAHGGRITAANRRRRGAVLTVSLSVTAYHSRSQEEPARGEEQNTAHR